MDAWTPEQLRRMQAGGNDALNAFLASQGVPKATDIRLKYNNKAAEARGGGGGAPRPRPAPRRLWPCAPRARMPPRARRGRVRAQPRPRPPGAPRRTAK